MKRPLKSCALVLIAFILLTAGTTLYSQGQTQDQAPRPARSRADETLEVWKAIGSKLVAMAQDFPEDKYDFKLQKDERTFARIFCTLPPSITTLCARLLVQTWGPTSAGTSTTHREGLTRRKPTWSS